MQKELELYEMLYLIDPTFTEQETTKKINFYQNYLTDRGSQVMIQDRGKRTLSYPIKGFETANYIQMFYVGNGDLITSLNKEIGRDDKILRHITTKVGYQPESTSE